MSDIEPGVMAVTLKDGERLMQPPCEPGDTGWHLTRIEEEGQLQGIHLVPINDFKLHFLDNDCWCKPEPDEEFPNMMLHNSMDKREDYENGRKVS